jgi:hypothetical protein
VKRSPFTAGQSLQLKPIVAAAPVALLLKPDASAGGQMGLVRLITDLAGLKIIAASCGWLLNGDCIGPI